MNSGKKEGVALLPSRKAVSEDLQDFDPCSICGMATFTDHSTIPPRDYCRVPGTDFCYGCKDSFEAKVWRAVNVRNP